MILSTQIAEQIVSKAQTLLGSLLNKNMPDLRELLEEGEEIDIGAKIKVTMRDAESGNHSDVDHRVKLSLSFSKKFTDSAESALEDPTQPKLPGLDSESQPAHFAIADVIAAAKRDWPEESLLRVHFDRLVEISPDNYGTEACGFQTFVADIGELVAHQSPEEGGAAEKGQGTTSLGAALDLVVAGSKCAPVILDLDKPDWQKPALIKAFRKAAKAADWNQAQVNQIVTVMQAGETIENVIASVRPHVKTESVHVEEPPQDDLDARAEAGEPPREEEMAPGGV